MNRAPYLPCHSVFCLRRGSPPNRARPSWTPIDVQVVEVDAVVTDRRGRPVSRLKREDFELFVDEDDTPCRGEHPHSSTGPSRHAISTGDSSDTDQVDPLSR
ncbi:MAG: hypothetical protein OXF79_23700 [Chloroflexi bacterium]|nr:hypothetical protein [Chloroflexota bacterium]